MWFDAFCRVCSHSLHWSFLFVRLGSTPFAHWTQKLDEKWFLKEQPMNNLEGDEETKVSNRWESNVVEYIDSRDLSRASLSTLFEKEKKVFSLVTSNISSVVSLCIMTLTDFRTTENVEVLSVLVTHQWNLTMEGEKPGVFLIDDTEKRSLQSRVKIYWSYPKSTQPLTLILETPFTKQQLKHKILFRDKCLQSMSKVFQIIDGEEIEKNINEDEVIFSTDSNYQVVLKFVPLGETTYGCFFLYEYVVE